MKFGRLITAMVTPFNHEMKIDEVATKKLVNHLIETGTDTIVAAGTTGESPTLSKEEKLSLFEKVLEFADGKAKVIAGTGTNDTKSAIALTKEAEEVGVDGIMLVAPYYNKPSQEGLLEHFKAIANETNLPVMIYNVPGRTGVNIQAKTIVRLSKIKNIFAVKEASGDITQMAEIIRDTDQDFYLYSGDDKMTLPALAVGGVGVVSVASHVVGNQIKEMMNRFFEGDIQQAAMIHQKLLALFEGIFITSNPVPIKALVKDIGIDVGNVRPPLYPMTDDQLAYLKGIFQQINV